MTVFGKLGAFHVVLLQSPQREQELRYESTLSTHRGNTTSSADKLRRKNEKLISNFITNTENKPKFEAQDFPAEGDNSEKDLVYTER